MTKDEWRLRVKDADGSIRYVPVTWSGLEIPCHEHHDPPADIVEVVHCKDCKHSYDSVGGWCCSHGVCVDCVVPEDFYCAYGEHKEDEG